jgi:hypothetical protein
MAAMPPAIHIITTAAEAGITPMVAGIAAVAMAAADMAGIDC